jgi:phosphoribosylformylglycinamidine synthase
MPSLRDAWEATSFALERRQANEECVAQEQAGLAEREGHTWVVPFTPAFTPKDKLAASDKVGDGAGWGGGCCFGGDVVVYQCLPS